MSGYTNHDVAVPLGSIVRPGEHAETDEDDGGDQEQRKH
jgi:hypothetical protein